MGTIFNPFTGTIDYTSEGAAVESVNGRTGNVTLDKSDVGLDQVDNTSDINKPISSATQTVLDDKLSKGGGDMHGDINMDGHHIIGLPTPVDANEPATKAYVESLVTGTVFYNPIIDPDLIDDNLNSPPGEIVNNGVYIIGPTPDGAWTGLARHAVYYDSGTSSWIDLLGRPIAAGDRFGVAMEYVTSGTINGQVSGTYDKQLLEVVTVSPLTYTFTVPAVGKSVFVANELSTHFGHAYNWNGTNWVEFLGPSNLVAGDALGWNGNILNVQHGAGINLNGSNQLELALDGSVPVTGDINFQDHTVSNVALIDNVNSLTMQSQNGIYLNTNLNTTPLSYIGSGSFTVDDVCLIIAGTQLIFPFTVSSTMTFNSVIYHNLFNSNSLTSDLYLVISSANNTDVGNIIQTSSGVSTGDWGFYPVNKTFNFTGGVTLSPGTYYFYLTTTGTLGPYTQIKSYIYANISRPTIEFKNSASSNISLNGANIDLNHSPLINAYIPNATIANDPINKSQFDTAINGLAGAGLQFNAGALDVQTTGQGISVNGSNKLELALDGTVPVTGDIDFNGHQALNLPIITNLEVVDSSNYLIVKSRSGIDLTASFDDYLINYSGSGSVTNETVLDKNSNIQTIYAFTASSATDFNKFIYQNLKNTNSQGGNLYLKISAAPNTLPVNVLGTSSAFDAVSISSTYENVTFTFPYIVSLLTPGTYYFYLDTDNTNLVMDTHKLDISSPDFNIIYAANGPVTFNGSAIDFNGKPLVNAYIPNGVSPHDPVNKAQLDAIATGGPPGDILETSFSISNNQSSATNITGFAFANSVVRSFRALVSIEISASPNLYQAVEIIGIQVDGGWDLSQQVTGSDCHILFSITTSGQMQYISGNISGFTSGKIKFRAITTTVG